MDKKQLEEWYREWRIPIRRWLANRSSIPTSELDDLCQEVFVRLLRYSDETLVEAPQSYLFKIASNIANEWRELRRNSRPHEQSWLDDIEENEAWQPDLLYAVDNAEKALYAAIDELPERDKDYILEHSTAELTYKEIAAKYGVTERVVLRQLTKVYSLLRMRLEREFGIKIHVEARNKIWHERSR